MYLLLGGNLGHPAATFQQAIALIQERIGTVHHQSALYETDPWGEPNQPVFLNQVLEVATLLAPLDILTETQRIEHELGRVRAERWGARLIDIDILYYGDVTLRSDALTLPHPRLHLRRFTLVPLADIAPTLRHPLLGKTTLELLQDCPDAGEVRKIS